MERRLTVGSLIKNKQRMEIAEFPSAMQSVIKIKQNNRPFQLLPISNELLLDIALKQGIPLDYKCRKGTCGRCAVEVLEGQNLLYRRTKRELEKSQNVNMRLACQARIK
ncbi:2Fe-2S iron-sulfur cluster-binding protein [Thermaerobacillus caldiproteolyticus]|uniref:2Fe-2S iron-sulfur cluster-binding protein n=1 Tax=Thermaerobacillus caldiproteolyticus TaxID=247480 RepID=UPI00188CDBAB|nr:2Fe-2S iron-sulfur cluster-binding protein [Anoxybacillus caldiproteolyticus]QPA31506.1 (2Fe-2S)-binding protein [Anoxybacillus caldiproteolyticus]